VPLLRGLRGLRPAVAGALTRIGVDCVLAAFLGALRGGGALGLSYAGLPMPRAAGLGSAGLDAAAAAATSRGKMPSAAPTPKAALTLLTATPTPSRAAIAAVGLTPHGAVQLAVDLAFLRLWLAFGAPTRTSPSPPLPAPVLLSSASASLFTPIPGHRAHPLLLPQQQQQPVPPPTPAPPGAAVGVSRPLMTPSYGPPPPDTAAGAGSTRLGTAASAAPPGTAPRPPTGGVGGSTAGGSLFGPWPGSFAELASAAGLLLLHTEPPIAVATAGAEQPTLPHLLHRRHAAAAALAAHALQHHSALAVGAHGIARLLPTRPGGSAASGLAAACSTLHAVTQAACDLALLPLVLEAASGSGGFLHAHVLPDPSAIASRLRVARTLLDIIAPPSPLALLHAPAAKSSGGGITPRGGGTSAPGTPEHDLGSSGATWAAWMDSGEVVRAAQAAVLASAARSSRLPVGSSGASATTSGGTRGGIHAGSAASGSVSARSAASAQAIDTLAPAATATVQPGSRGAVNTEDAIVAADAAPFAPLLPSLRVHVDAGHAGTWCEAMDHEGYGLTAAKAVLASLDTAAPAGP
jgi:hypothetical protein